MKKMLNGLKGIMDKDLSLFWHQCEKGRCWWWFKGSRVSSTQKINCQN